MSKNNLILEDIGDLFQDLSSEEQNTITGGGHGHGHGYGHHKKKCHIGYKGSVKGKWHCHDYHWAKKNPDHFNYIYH